MPRLLLTSCWLAALLTLGLAPAAETPQAESGAINAPALKPPSAADIDAAIHRGVAFLLKKQNPNGSWGSPHNTKDLNIYAPAPGAHLAFRSGTTGLAWEALMDTGLAESDPAIKQAIEKAGDWMLENLPHLRRAETAAIYNSWGHIYGLESLARYYQYCAGQPKRQEKIAEVMRAQIDCLRRYEYLEGGWGYYDFRHGTQRPTTYSCSFVTAAALVALDRSRAAGILPPADLVKRAVESVQRQSKPDHSYIYGEYLRLKPMHLVNRPPGSLGRSQACNLALKLWGDQAITETVFTNWLDRLVVRNDWLSFGRKRPVPHESWFAVAGYFFYFGHYYAALCIDQVNPKSAPLYRSSLAAIVLPLQETDGSWWDYPLYDYHQQYGTGYAIMTLLHCREPGAGRLKVSAKSTASAP